MTLPGSSRSAAYSTDGTGLNGSAAATRLGHRQGNLSRTSLVPDDSVSVAGGMARSTASKRSVPPKTPAPAEKPPSSHNATKDPEYIKLVGRAQVTMIPRSEAPLAPRVSIPPIPPKWPMASLEKMTLELQEATILEDILYVLMGFEGQYIRYHESYDPTSETDRLAGPKFRIAPGLDPSLRDLSQNIIKIATWYSSVSEFVNVQSKPDFGVVNHALCAAIRSLLRDYLTLIAQFEHQFRTNPSFTLQSLQIHSRPVSQVLFQLHSLTYEISRRNSLVLDDDDDELDNLDDVENILESLREGKGINAAVGGTRTRISKGGIILGILAQRLSTLAGDISARALLQKLLHESSKPYMHMLNLWLHHGEINDPHGEFLIKEQKSIRKEKLDEDYTDEYWDKRYTIRDDEVPPQLEAVKDKVLLAGKYLNVVRECGGIDVAKDKSMEVPLTFDDPRFLENINSAYSYANTSLLNLLITTHALPDRLRSLRHYFFLDRSDFFTHFLDLASNELKKSSKLVSITKLQSLLDLSLRQPGSIAASDPFKEDVKVQMNDMALTDWLMRIVSVSGLGEEALSGGAAWTDESPVNQESASDEKKTVTGVNALQLDYTVPFPLSLVISRKAVLRYQLIFRHLLALKHIEQLLGLAWTDHIKTPTWRNRSSHPRVEKWKLRVWALRSRMLVFIQQLSYFCTNEVIEPNWVNLQSRLEKVTTVDELMRDHIDFLDTCLKECMLTNSRLLRIHSKLMTTCTMFATYTPQLSRGLQHADPGLLGSQKGDDEKPLDTDRMQKLDDALGRYDQNFTHHLRIFANALNYYAATESVALLGLVSNLDWNRDWGMSA